MRIQMMALMIVDFCLTRIRAIKHPAMIRPGSISVVGIAKKVVRKMFWGLWKCEMISRPIL